MFGKYHYLSNKFNKAARVFLCMVNGDVAGFCGVLPFPHPRVKNACRGHRTVVLPDYQGVGIGVRFSDMVAELMLREGKRYLSTTSNPAMIHHRVNSKEWILRRQGRVSKGSDNGFQNKHDLTNTSANRLTCGFEYVGNDNLIYMKQEERRKRGKYNER